MTKRSDIAAMNPAGVLAGAAVDPALTATAQRDARRRRRRQRHAATLIALSVFCGIAALIAQVGLSDTNDSAGVAPRVAVQSEAVGVRVLRPGAPMQRIAAARPVAGGTTRVRGVEDDFQLPGIVDVQRLATSGRINVQGRSANASARVGRIDVMDGRIVLLGAGMTARAASRDGAASGSLKLSTATVLRIDGVQRPARMNERIAIENVGTLIVNEQAVVSSAPRGDAQTGPRHRVVGAVAHLRITTSVAGLSPGTEIIIGQVDSGVREGKVRRIAHPPSSTLDVSSPTVMSGGIQRGMPKPGEATLPRRATAVRGAAATGALAGSLQGYLFPVLGRNGYSNDWGAPRASTGVPHQGTDIFADEGTPIVALADGVLDRVGWNPIGGYRFWLFDSYGNAFYHAHLSAFSPVAQDGARVRRGDVIGFVGHSGDAQFTPPHLHFEVHPGNGEAINPFPLLGAWKQGVAVSIGLLAGGVERVAPMTLLGFTDISANSGLQQTVLASVPDTRARTIEQEREPRPTDATLKGAIEGPGISRGG